MTISNAMSVAGTGISSGGSLFNTALTAASVTGPITLTANSTFISTPGITLGTVNGGAYSLAVTAGTGAGTGDITLNGTVTFSGENISTFTASRNLNINAPINVNGTTAASGIALVYNKANSTGDYNFGLTASGSGATLAASFSGAIVGLVLKLTHRLRDDRYVPFGPFLAMAGLVVAVLGMDAIAPWMGW